MLTVFILISLKTEIVRDPTIVITDQNGQGPDA